MKVHFQKHKKAFCTVTAVFAAIAVYMSLYTAVLPSIAVVGGSCVGAVTFIVSYSIAQGQFGALFVRNNLERLTIKSQPKCVER